MIKVEKPTHPPNPTQMGRILRCIWFDQSLATDKLRTDDGRKLRVLSPGWWNLESGPDFRNAALRIAGGAVAKGDVAVRVSSTQWSREHCCEQDTVVLFVCLYNGSGQTQVVNSKGNAIPQITLKPYLMAPDYYGLPGPKANERKTVLETLGRQRASSPQLSRFQVKRLVGWFRRHADQKHCYLFYDGSVEGEDCGLRVPVVHARRSAERQNRGTATEGLVQISRRGVPAVVGRHHSQLRPFLEETD